MFRLPPVYSRLSLERRRSSRSVGSSVLGEGGFLGFGRGLANKREYSLGACWLVTTVAGVATFGLAADDCDELLIQCHTEMRAMTSSTTIAPSFVRSSAPIFTATSLPSLIAFWARNHPLGLSSAPR